MNSSNGERPLSENWEQRWVFSALEPHVNALSGTYIKYSSYLAYSLSAMGFQQVPR